MEEFLGIIIHSNGHGEYVSQKTRNAIVQIMAPDRHTNTVDIEEFEFIMKYHAKKRNVKFNRFDGYKSFDRPNKSNMRNDAIEKTLNFHGGGLINFNHFGHGPAGKEKSCCKAHCNMMYT